MCRSPPAVGSGFRSISDSQAIPEINPVAAVSHAHVRFAGRGSDAIAPLPSRDFSRPDSSPLPILVGRTPTPQDVPMNLGGGKNTDSSGLGDSKHAAAAGVPESSLPSQIVSVPATASSITVNMIDALNDIAAGKGSSPMSESSEHSYQDIADVLFTARDRYDSIGDVIDDLRTLGSCHNRLVDVLDRALGTIMVLENEMERDWRRINKLEDTIDTLKADGSRGPVEATLSANTSADTRNQGQIPDKHKHKPKPPVAKGPPPPIPPRPSVVTGPAACVLVSWTEVVKRKPINNGGYTTKATTSVTQSLLHKLVSRQPPLARSRRDHSTER